MQIGERDDYTQDNKFPELCQGPKIWASARIEEHIKKKDPMKEEKKQPSIHCCLQTTVIYIISQ